MRRLTQRVAKFMDQVVRVLAAYYDLLLAWLGSAAARIFPTPVRVRAVHRQHPRSRSARTRR